ncbi:MAG: hypothetical protein ACQEUZ_02715 [Pseudomonadota bacterium]
MFEVAETGPLEGPPSPASPRAGGLAGRCAGGPGATGLRFLEGRGETGLSAWLALPPRPAPGAEPLVAVHGIGRDGFAQAQALAGTAARQGRAVVAPVFEAGRWPAYQRAVARGRADLALIDLLRTLRLAGLPPGGRIALAGYSGGAQFAHRFAMLHPQLVSRLTVISAGWYTFPDEAPFPYGLAAPRKRGEDWGARMAARLETFLRLPIEICVGSEDREADETLRSSAALDAQQGRDRVERARRWRDALAAAAAARGLPARARLHVLPGAGHDFQTCLRAGGLDRILPPEEEGGA